MNEISPPPLRNVYLEDAKVVSHPQFISGDEAPNLRDYWKIVRKYKWLIGICFVSAVVLTLVVLFSTTPIYTASATLLIERKGPQVVDIKQVLSESVEADEHSYYESQYAMLKSRSLAAQVIK